MSVSPYCVSLYAAKANVNSCLNLTNYEFISLSLFLSSTFFVCRSKPVYYCRKTREREGAANEHSRLRRCNARENVEGREIKALAQATCRAMNYLRIRAHRWIREFTAAGLAKWDARVPRSVARWLHCFNKAGKHILFLVTPFTSRKKVKLLAKAGQRIVLKSRASVRAKNTAATRH